MFAFSPRHLFVQIFTLLYLFFSLLAFADHGEDFHVDFGLSAPATSSGNYTVSWTANAGATYILQEKYNGGSYSNAYVGTGGSKSFTGKPSGAYSYRILQQIDVGIYGWLQYYSEPVVVTVTATPATPASISTPTTDGDGGFTVSWSAANNATNYILQQQLNGGSWSQILSGGVTSKVVSNLADGVYKFRVKGCNTSGCSTWKTSADSIVANAPSVPSSIAISPANSTTKNHTVNWAAASGSVANYQLERQFNGGGWALVYTGGALSQGFNNLTDGNYSYRVRACNTVSTYTNCSGYRASSISIIAYVALPINFTAPTGDGDGAYTVSWQSGGGTATNYTLQEQINGGAWATVQNTAALSKSFSGKANASYSYRVRACSTAGCTGYTAKKTVQVTQVGVPGAISGPSNLDEVDDFTLSWGAASGTVTRYELQEQAGSGSWSLVYSGSALSHTFNNHGYGDFSYRVRACDSNACGSFTAVKTVSITLTEPPLTPPGAYNAIGNLGSLVSQTEIDNTDKVGSIRGSFRVNEGGQATYTIPVATAAGTAGVAPQISLNYSSQGGNGLVGLGWSVGGLSAISRCRQTLHQDQNPMPITWSANDRFCLDGQRLTNVSGTYGAPGSIYKTEIDSFAKITAVGGSTGHPDYWSVERKDGSVSTYGGSGSHSSEQQARDSNGSITTNTLTWALRHVKDSVGNKIIFVYTDSVNGHRLNEVRYAYGSGTTPGAKITFTYEARADDILAFVAGYQFTNTQRLKTIKSYNGGSIIRQYNLAYESTTSTNTLSRLGSIEECVGGKCLPKTTFDWSLPSFGFGTASSINLSPKSDRGVYNYQPADINGDGMMDLVWLEWDQDGTNTDHQLKYALSDGTKLALAYFSNGATEITYGENVGSETVKFAVIDYNADGRQDLIVYNSRAGAWRVHLSKPQQDGSWRLDSAAITTPVTQEQAGFLDVNSDGLVDVVYSSLSSADFQHRLLTIDQGQSTSSSRYYKFGDEVTLQGFVQTTTAGNGDDIVNESPGEIKVVGDLNGDGLSDFEVTSDLTTCAATFPMPTCGTHQNKKYLYVLNRDSTVSLLEDLGSSYQPTAYADINSDGLTDLLLKPGSSPWGYKLNTGTSLTALISLSGVSKDAVQTVDYNNDGYTDVLWHASDNSKIKVRLWNPDTNSFQSAIDVKNTNGSEDEAHLFLDMNGDGVVDHLRFASSTLYTFKGTSTSSRQQITKITNGLGAETDITYKPLGISGHYDRLGLGVTTQTIHFCYPVNSSNCSSYSYSTADVGGFYSALNGGWDLPSGSNTLGKPKPVLELNGPMSVVTRVDSSAPTATNANSKSAISYYYGEAKIQASGRGMLGFQKLKTVDEQTGVETVTTYRQDWPFIGYPLKTEVYSSAGHKLSESENTWSVKNISNWSNAASTAQNSGTKALGSLQPYIKESIETTYNLANNGASAGGLLQTVTTENTYDNYGNPTQIKVTTSGGGKNFQKVTNNTYLAPGLGSTYSQEKGRLSETVVISKRDEDGDGNYEKSSTRTSSFTYYTSGVLTGLLKDEVIEPNNGLFTVTTTHSYDSFGNKVRAKVVAGGETRCDVNTAQYDSSGRYVNATFDCLGRKTSEVLSRNELGEPLSVRSFTNSTSSNSVTSYYRYTARGIRYFEANDAGSWKANTIKSCAAGDNCPTGARYFAKTTAAGGSESREYYDRLGRSIRQATIGFNGNWVYADSQYDNLGRVVKKSEPYYVNSSIYWTSVNYDVLGRTTQITMPDGSSASTAYNGLTTVTTNALNQSKTEIKNVVGELVRVTDHLNGYITYNYDAQGNMVGVQDSSGNVTALVYDLLGRKTAMSDPDKGAWTYDYNGFGELVEQTDAKGQRSVMTYDALGRMVTRKDYRANNSVEGNTAWAYDTAPNGLGQLDFVQDVVSGYLKAIEYDPLGRVSKTVTSLGVSGADGDHYEKVTYDQFGRTYQIFDAARNDDTYNDNGVQHHYNPYGYQHKLTDAVYVNGAPRQTYQEVQSMDARGKVTQQYLASGVIEQNMGYEADSGRIIAINARHLGMSSYYQDLSVIWDELGNLLQRREQGNNRNLTENFTYDGLNRLTSSQVVGKTAQTLSYNSIGNITYKSDVGNYSYGSNAGPHAVTNAGGVTYSYDANGNNTGSSDGRSITYSTFDKATLITKGNHRVAFQYGPDRARYKRIDTNTSTNKVTTTLYIGAVEKILNPNGSREWKRQLGNVILTQKFDGSGNQTAKTEHYLLKDHLGSLSLLIDSSGNVAQQMDFDPWGQRRTPTTWAEIQQTELQSSYFKNFTLSAAPLTSRGFTGHEMVDEVGIIHMNGRIYDARLGRFLQADPIIQDPGHTQSLNRYSYGFNNPLNGTDPSGYVFGVDDLFIAFAVAIVSKAAVELEIPWLATIANIVGCSYGYCVASSFGSTYGATGSFNDALKAGATAFVAEAAFSSIGDKFNHQSSGFFEEGGLGHIAAHGIAGGVLSELQDGKFGHGFISAGILKAVSPGLSKIRGPIEIDGKSLLQAMTAATLGGTLSKLSGGKFANGAITGAFQNLFNDQKHAQKGADQNSSPAQPEGSTANPLSTNSASEFKQCVNTCIQNRYGSLYEAADALNPLSVSGLVGNEVAEVLDTELQKQGNRNSYGNAKEFRTGRRQLKTLSQFRKFNVASLVVGAGAIGFQLGAQGYCRVECTNFGD